MEVQDAIFRPHTEGPMPGFDVSLEKFRHCFTMAEVMGNIGGAAQLDIADL